jgi:DNA-binding YbaB/EbfC family protein
MFGNNMMKKMQEMQAQVEESKKRLDAITVEGEAMEGKVKVTLNGNRKLVGIHISDSMLKDREELEDMLAVAFNRALERAENVNETEMRSAASGLMPGM